MEEEDLDNSHLLMSDLQQSDLDHRLSGGRNASPTHERAREMPSISSLLGGDHNDRTSSPQFGADPTSMIQRQLIKSEDDVSAAAITYNRAIRVSYQKARQNGGGASQEFEKLPFQSQKNARKPQKKPLGVLNQSAPSSSSNTATANASTTSVSSGVVTSSQIPTPPSAHVTLTPNRRIYSTTDSNDPLNAEIGDDIYIDTKDLCKRIAFELKNHSIPQAIFAERILCRSQGTLSDLLRNPKPWNKLKSGRETFRRMYNWVSQPLNTRLAILDMKTDEANRATGISPPTPAQNVRTHRKSTSDHDGPISKRPRLVFTDIQKRTLQAIFKETQRPSREMQQTIAEHLRLDLSTVANFFMNARRRSRLGGNLDEPTPFQQVRQVTPPPPGADPLNVVNGDELDGQGPLTSQQMNEMFKDDAPLEISAEQRQLIERGFGVPVAGVSQTLSSQLAQIHQNGGGGGAHEDEEEAEDELAYEEEDVDVGEEEEEEEEEDEATNGDVLPKAEEEKTAIKEEVPDDDGEYATAATATAGH
uniref:One cut domain family member n=2 Tax=Caenorhabditis japonica TaxID=281687 RepID=A0A8R1HJR6_CAEJA